MTAELRFTSADLELLPDVEGVRYEIIDGELHVSRAPDWHHQYACTRLVYAFETWNDQTRAGVALQAPGLVFGPPDDVVPDVVWMSHERLAASVDDAGHFRRAPELVVEVLSYGARNERRDRELKLRLYSSQGVREYWIVDWRARAVQVFRRDDAALKLVATLEGDDVLTTPLLPGFACPLPDLWGSLVKE